MADNSQFSTEQLIEERAQRLADERFRQQRVLNQIQSTGRIYTRFDVTDIIENQKETVTAPMWTNGQASLNTFYTSSTQSTTQKQYFYSVFQSQSNLAGAEKQFDVAYGHRFGSGSVESGTDYADYPSKSVYSQYKQLLLDAGDTTFTFKNSVNSDQIYVVSFDRSKYKDRVDPGNWELPIGKLNGDAFVNQYHTGSNVTVLGTSPITLIDDSGDTDESQVSVTSAGRVYNIVSGTLENGTDSNNTQGFGLFYPDLGLAVLNADMLDASASFNSVTTINTAGDNAFKLFTAISGSPIVDSTLNFDSRNSETVTSTYYYVRCKAPEYNFSNNPSFVTGSVGEFRNPDFVQDPKSYITTIGLYNDSQELLAVAKLSKPLIKTFTRDLVIKCKLDW